MNGSDLVIGSRMAGAASEMPLTRRVGNLFFAALLSLVGATTHHRQRQRDAGLQAQHPGEASTRCRTG